MCIMQHFEVNIKVVMSLKLMTSTRVGKMEGSHFEGSPSLVNYSHMQPAASCSCRPVSQSEHTIRPTLRGHPTLGGAGGAAVGDLG